MLHTVNKSPFEKNSLATCLRLARAGSDILLLEDAVYAALAGAATGLEQALGAHTVFVLEADMAARGIARDALIDGVRVVDYDGFVDLCAGNDSVQCWL